MNRTLSAPQVDRCIPFLLAGGRGSRLHELTDAECKPALHFGSGSGRIVDFILDAVVRAGFPQLFVATQYRPYGLCRHLRDQWSHHFPRGISIRDGELISPSGYRGTADAIRLNATTLDAYAPREVMVLSGDHVADVDLTRLLDHHRAQNCAVTVAATAVPASDASGFGVFTTDARGQVTAFHEKPDTPATLHDDPGISLASTGIYIFDWLWLRDALGAEALRPGTRHDFGHDILPRALAEETLSICRISSSETGGDAYWRDVGTLGAYRRTLLDLAQGRAKLALPRGMGLPVTDAIDCVVNDTVFLPGSSAGRNCTLRNTVVAPGVRLPDGFRVGVDAAEDARWFRMGDDGTVLVTAEMMARRKAAIAPLHSRVAPLRTARPAAVGSSRVPPRSGDVRSVQ